MAGLPPGVGGVIPSNSSGPNGFSSLGGAGLPSTGVTHGAPAQSVSSLLNGSGLNGFDSMHTGRTTSTADPVSNPRGTIHTQYFIDCEKTDPDADLGDMELAFMDVESFRPGGAIGQNEPMRFMSLSRLNYWLKLPEQRRQFGHEKDVRWFDKQWSFVGICRHLDTKGRAHAEAGNICQLFETGFRTRCFDVWQSYAPKHSPSGPEIGDLLQLMLRKYKMESTLDRDLAGTGRPDPNPYYWQLVPVFTHDNSEISPKHLMFADGAGFRNVSMGKSMIIGRVASIYGPLTTNVSRTAARNMVWNPTSDAGYKKNTEKLRQLEIEVATV